MPTFIEHGTTIPNRNGTIIIQSHIIKLRHKTETATESRRSTEQSRIRSLWTANVPAFRMYLSNTAALNMPASSINHQEVSRRGIASSECKNNVLIKLSIQLIKAVTLSSSTAQIVRPARRQLTSQTTSENSKEGTEGTLQSRASRQVHMIIITFRKSAVSSCSLRPYTLTKEIAPESPSLERIKTPIKLRIII